MMQEKCLEKDTVNHSFKIRGCYYGDKTLPSLNDYIHEIGRNPKNAGTMKKQYMAIVINAIRRDLRHFKATKPVLLHYVFCEPNKGQKRDYGNIFSCADKFIEDALVICKIIPDDNPNYVKGFSHTFIYTNGEPYISVEIEEVDS